MFVLSLFLISGCAKEEQIFEEEPIEEIVENETNYTINVSEESFETEENISEELEEDIMNISKERTIRIIELRMSGDNMKFSPKELRISLGDTVRWVNKLDYLNRSAEVVVYAHLGLFRSLRIGYDESFEHNFSKEGEFSYGVTPYTTLFQTGKVIVSNETIENETYECIVSSDCYTFEKCVNNECVLIECEEGKVAKGHKCEDEKDVTPDPPCVLLGCDNNTIYVGNNNTNEYYECDSTYAIDTPEENILCFDDFEEVDNLTFVS